MANTSLKAQIGGMDIYLLDQILQGRYQQEDVILDAGCGTGRNLKWFYNQDIAFKGVDTNAGSLQVAKDRYAKTAANFSVHPLDILPFDSATFNHVICSAVLHFAQNTQHFLNMFSELIRVLKPGGSLFIRMTSIESIEARVEAVGKGVYILPDRTHRFLLTDALLVQVMTAHNLLFMAPKKYVNVANERCMSTLLLQKQ